MSRFLELAAVLSLAAAPALADGIGLGREATADEIAAWDIDIRPDGAGLPEGRGNAWDGEEIFAEQCAVCHGDFGEAVGRWPMLAGGFNTLDRDDPVKTIGSYWPYLSTVWDYVNRAMPFGNAQSLSADEVYAITAYILYVNNVVDDEEFELSNENFTEIRMPNEDGFFMDDRADTEYAKFSGDVCMVDCKDSVEITARARILDVTPDVEEEEEEASAAEPAPAETELASAEPAAEAAIAPDPQLVAEGEKVFRKCKSCHQVGEDAKNRTGPTLNGIVGMAAGAVDGFRYSNAMSDAAEAGTVWDDENLAAFLADPRGYMRGTKMSFRGLASEEEISAVIAYLRTFDG